MESHDLALHFIATELELIATRTEHPQPNGVDWDKVRPDQFADIPFLSALRDTIERRKAAPVTLPIIDLGSLGEREASPTRIVAEVGAACRDVGFFYVVNHGVDPGADRPSLRSVARLLRAARRRQAEAGDRDNWRQPRLFRAPSRGARPRAGTGHERGLQRRSRPCRGRSRIAGGSALPLAQRLARRAGLPRNAAFLLRCLRGPRRPIASRVRAATLA